MEQGGKADTPAVLRQTRRSAHTSAGTKVPIQGRTHVFAKTRIFIIVDCG